MVWSKKNIRHGRIWMNKIKAIVMLLGITLVIRMFPLCQYVSLILTKVEINVIRMVLKIPKS